ncbi:MAG TPA: glycosyltransferase family 87 protein [Xanthobacteraceae bacterium]|nr:glycosyltransferase family 87 protein [Xanthobacteraceae bacterium]
MQPALAVLRSGSWLTRERVRLVAIAVFIASVAGLFYLVVTAHGLIDIRGRPLGTDFSDVYAAGSYVLDGTPGAPFDPARQHAREQQIFGEATPFYGWHYPPFFLFIATALALMPYGIALIVWQAVTLALYLLVMRAIVFPSPSARGEGQGEGASPRSSELRQHPLPLASLDLSPHAGRGDYMWLLLAVAFPAVLINVGHGQNGFLTAALLAGALLQLDRRPIVSGILIGCLAYKPQFGLMIPLVLAVTGRWRVFAAAAATVAVLALATTVAFGPHVWQAFLDSTRFTRIVALEHGDTGWYKIQSLFAWVRMWGAPISVAYALQGALVIALGAGLIRLWRSAVPFALKAAGLCLATVLATPYTFDYDMMVLAPAIAFIARDGMARGFGPWEKTALAALWLVPLVARSIAYVTFIPLGVPTMLAMFVLLLRCSTIYSALPTATSSAILLK